MKSKFTYKICENPRCCSTVNLTKHHLIPRRARRFLGITTTEDNKNKIMLLCDDCHKLVHKLKTIIQLAKKWNTKDMVILLLDSDEYYKKRESNNKIPISIVYNNETVSMAV